MEPIFLTCMVIAYFFTKGKVETAAYANGKEPPGVTKARLRHEAGGGARTASGRPKGKGAFRLMMADRWANACEAVRQHGEHKARRRRAWYEETAPLRDAAWREKQLAKLEKKNAARARWAADRGLIDLSERRERKIEDEAWKENQRRDAEQGLADGAAGSPPDHGRYPLDAAELDHFATLNPEVAEEADRRARDFGGYDGGLWYDAVRDIKNAREATDVDRTNVAEGWEGMSPEQRDLVARVAGAWSRGEHADISAEDYWALPVNGRARLISAAHVGGIPVTWEDREATELADQWKADLRKHAGKPTDPSAGNSDAVAPESDLDAGAPSAEEPASAGDAGAGETPGDDPAAASATAVAPATNTATEGTSNVYAQAVTRLIAAADQVAEYRADLAAFADTLDGKRWGAEVTGPIKDMDGQLIALEGDYRDLAAQMKHQGDQGAAAHEQAPWVPDDESILV
ncbi:hypothetical protein [Amycolatopsis sacchari]|uniref:hypothetical protein n=1 Tax=Amycolatopsis sacchari TaxID=115433 RepID=UPI003D742194